MVGKRIAVQIGTTGAAKAESVKDAKVTAFNTNTEAAMEFKRCKSRFSAYTQNFCRFSFFSFFFAAEPATIKDKAAKTAIAISKYFFILQPPEKYLDCTQHAALYIC